MLSVNRILEFCIEPKTSQEIMEYLNLKNKEYFRKNILRKLIENGKIVLTIPEKPTSPSQKYRSKRI